MNTNDANEYLKGTIQIPSSLVITAITKTFPMIVTCEVDAITDANTYVVCQLVRLTVPNSYGMSQANQLTAQITAINGLDFSLLIDARGFDPFVIPAYNSEAPASLSPAGSRNLAYSNTTNRIGFQSLNNRGN